MKNTEINFYSYSSNALVIASNKHGYGEVTKNGNYRKTIRRTERHMMEIDLNRLDIDKLIRFKREIPEGYTFRIIDQNLFEKAKKSKFAANFIKAYSDYRTFQNAGFGYFVLQNDKIVAGISAFERYQAGVEVKVAVAPEHRGKHLARSLGAMFILECKVRNLYPWWDCSTAATIHLAKELGYYLRQNAPAC